MPKICVSESSLNRLGRHDSCAPSPIIFMEKLTETEFSLRAVGPVFYEDEHSAWNDASAQS